MGKKIAETKDISTSTFLATYMAEGMETNKAITVTYLDKRGPV